MKYVIAILALAWSVIASAQWIEGSTIGVPYDNGKRPVAIFATYIGSGEIPNQRIPPGVWTSIDLTNGPKWDRRGNTVDFQPNIPEDTLAVFLSGILVITHPGTSVICNVVANFRAPGSTLPAGSYQMQVIEASRRGGSRTNASVWVPVENRVFEFYWWFTPGCPSIVNLSLQAYVR